MSHHPFTLWSAVALCLAVTTLSACHHDEHPHHEVGRLAVTTPLRQGTELSREYVGSVHAIQHIELRALEGGYLQSIYVDEGKMVSEGQRLFQIMPLIYQAEVNKAAAETELARIEFANTEALAKQNIVSPTELALAKAKLNKAQAEQALAETHKGLTTIRAPFGGLMGRLHVRHGSLLEEGELLSTLSDNSSLWIYFNVTEREYLDYISQPPQERAAKVSFVMANGKVFEEPGVIETIEADFDHETGNIAFRATFKNPKGVLRHGETGKVVMSRTVENALLIPQKATFEVLDRQYVYVVDADDVIHSRQVHIAAELPNVYVLSGGLEDNERILLEGLRKVHDEQQIETDPQPIAEVYSHLELHAE